MKPDNREPDRCRECYSCIKICLQNAIEARLDADIVPPVVAVQPLRGSGSCKRSIECRHGIRKRFQLPIRTTPEGSIDPFGGKPAAEDAGIERPSSSSKPAAALLAIRPG